MSLSFLRGRGVVVYDGCHTNIPLAWLRKATPQRAPHSGGGASFRRIARHKGVAVAVFATARQLARLVYRMLRYGHDHVDIGEKAYEQHFESRRLAAITETAKSPGYGLVPQSGAA